MSSSKRIGTRLLLGSAALAGLAFIGYATLPVLLAGWVQRLLTEQGLTDVRVEIGYPALHRLRVHQLMLSGRSAGQVYTLSARELEVGYDLASVLQGRLQSLRIPEAQLDFRPGELAARTPRRPFALPQPARWLAAFPLDKLHVDQLQVQWHQPDGTTLTGTLRGEAQRTDTQLRMHWSLSRDHRPWLDLALNLTDAGELSATLSQAQAPDQPMLSASATVAANGPDTVVAHGSIDAQFKPLALLLSPLFSLPKDFTPDAGRLTARWNATAPAVVPAADHGGEFSGTLSVDVTALRLGTLLQDGNLHLLATFATGDNILHWRIADNLRLSAYLNPALLAITDTADRHKFVRSARPLVVRAPRGLSGDMRLAPFTFELRLAPDSRWQVENLVTPDVHIARLDATLPGETRLARDTHGGWTTTGLGIALHVPALQPLFAAIGAVENLRVTARLEAGSLSRPPPVTVQNADVTVFGGHVRARDVRVDLARAENTFTLDLERIDLAHVVALEQQQDIEATGTLDGRMPFILSRRGMRIADGALHASPAGGVIRYHPNETVRSMAVANPNLKLVLDALSNYHYTKLDIGANYAENGDLALQVGMAGRNPDWNANQPIHLNINLSENIPVLLRSLRLASDISEKVEQRVRERSRSTP